ncbi:MAG: integrase [Mesorhizobium sp.]
MVTTVKLEGLNVRQSRGKWYVSIRKTGETFVKGFVGTRDDLDRHLADPDILRAYSVAKTRDRRKTYSEGTLGDLVAWFKSDCPRWGKLSPASQADYEKTFKYLDPEFDILIEDIDQAQLYEVRDTAAKAKWGRFADKMISHLSTMFREAVKKKKMRSNPAIGVEKTHSADPNANHEWQASEVATALAQAPRWIKTPMVLARYQGFRGQTCRALTWRNYIDDPRTIKAFDLTLRKNNELAWFPCEPETIEHLAGLTKTSTFICTTSEDKPWKDEKSMQGAVSDFLSGLKDAGLIRQGCTLHGLRVTYAASIRRMDLDAGTVADALGDRSTRMGEHYTRHVEKEAGRMRAWKRKNGVQNG